VDVYSFGVLLVALFVGTVDWGEQLPPRHNERVKRLLELSLSGRTPVVPRNTRPMWVAPLVTMCLAMQPSVRPSFADIVSVIMGGSSSRAAVPDSAVTSVTVTDAPPPAGRVAVPCVVSDGDSGCGGGGGRGGGRGGGGGGGDATATDGAGATHELSVVVDGAAPGGGTTTLGPSLAITNLTSRSCDV
jgi:uncharacterized membrane protein YgcG